MDARNNNFDFNFTPIGQAIKKARTAKGMTRDELARVVDYDPRHLQAIENEGQKPSPELFIQLVTMFGVSVDEYIFPDNDVKRSFQLRLFDCIWQSFCSSTLCASSFRKIHSHRSMAMYLTGSFPNRSGNICSQHPLPSNKLTGSH